MTAPAPITAHTAELIREMRKPADVPETNFGDMPPLPDPHPRFGFSVGDMRAYARAYGDARALAAVREPLSDAEIAGLFVELNTRAITTDSAVKMFTIIVRAVEEQHGITAQAQQEVK